MRPTLQPKTFSSQHKSAEGPYTDIRQLTQLRYAAKEIDLVAMSKAINPLSGLLTSNFRGRGIDFAEVRIYQPGDDIRTIDWRVTARTQKPHTKLFQEEKERPVLIIVDQSKSMFFGSRVTFKSVAAAQAAALIAWTALEGGDRVGGLVFSDSDHREIRPRRSKHSVLRLLYEIDRFNHQLGRFHSADSAPGLDKAESRTEDGEPANHTNYFAGAVSKIRQVAKHGSTIFFISDFMRFDDEVRIHFNQLARHNDIVGIHIADELEKSLPPPDQYYITNGEQRTRINTSVRKNRDTFQQHFVEHLQSIRNEFGRVRAPFFELVTHESVVNSLANQYTRYAHSQHKKINRKTGI